MSNLKNPYAPILGNESVRGEIYPLAGLDKRLIGAIYDMIVGLVLLIPAVLLVVADMLAGNGSGEIGILSILGFVWALLAALAVTVLNLYLLATRSQSIGKYFVKTQIVSIEDDQPAGFVKAFVMRALVSGLLGGIPLLGMIYTIVDYCFIFRDDRRCIHDLIAGTRVVDIS